MAKTTTMSIENRTSDGHKNLNEKKQKNTKIKTNKNKINKSDRKNGLNNITDTKKDHDSVINVLYTNADSISNKLNELKTHAAYYKADLILITEYLSKNKNSNFKDIFCIDGFNCLEDNSGRGVCIFYKNHLDLYQNEQLKFPVKPAQVMLCIFFSFMSLIA